MRNKRLIVAGFVAFSFLAMGSAILLSNSPSLLSSIAFAQTPYNDAATQSQTTFFEKYPTDTPIPSKTPTPRPQASAPRPTYPPIPTSYTAPAAPPPRNLPSVPSVPSTPGSGNNCPDTVPLTQNCDCNWGPGDKADICTRNGVNISQVGRPDSSFLPQSTSADGTTCYSICMTKPVIYLYPEKPTALSVWINTPGRVYKSIPHYVENGWPGLTAYPDGTITQYGHTYKELYYEFELNEDIQRPSDGIYLEKKTLRADLKKLVMQRGLTDYEAEEFLEWWYPQLAELPEPYILVSFFDEEYKQKIDEVQFTVQPDVFIEFLAYFKPVMVKTPVKTLHMPEVPKRKGFTAVEWGGYIDN